MCTVPDVAISPSGDVSVEVGTSFSFNCTVTVKIPPLPTEIFINGEPVEDPARIVQNPPVTLHPLIIENFILLNVSTDDNGTVLQCAAFLESEDIVASNSITLAVFGEYVVILE